MKNTLTKLALIAALALIADGCSSQITPPTPAGWQAIAEVAARDAGTGDLVRVRQNEQSTSGMEWQVIAVDPSEPSPVEPLPAEEPE